MDEIRIDRIERALGLLLTQQCIRAEVAIDELKYRISRSAAAKQDTAKLEASLAVWKEYLSRIDCFPPMDLPIGPN